MSTQQNQVGSKQDYVYKNDQLTLRRALAQTVVQEQREFSQEIKA